MKALKVLLVIILVLGISVAMGKVPGKAAAQDGVVITPTSINRLGGPDTTVKIEDNNDMDTVSTPDGNYLAMLVTTTRLPEPGEPCRMLYPPPYPGAPCLVKERMLIVYDTTTEPDTLIGYKAGGFNPYAVKFVRLDGQLLVAVVEGYPYQLGFYDLTCQEVDQTLLPENFGDQYYLDGYMDFNVAYIDDEPLIIVAGGVVIADPTEALSGLLVGVARNPLTGNFEVQWTEIGGCAGIITQIDSAAVGDGTVTSALLCEEYVDDETVKDHVIVKSGSTLSFPGVVFYAWAKDIVDGKVDGLRKMIVVELYAQSLVLYMMNKVTLDGVLPVITPIVDGVPMAEITVAEGVPGVSVSGRGIFAVVDHLQKIVVICIAGNKFEQVSKEHIESFIGILVLDPINGALLSREEVTTPRAVTTGIVMAGTVKGKIQLKESLYIESSETISVGTHSSPPVGGPPGGTDVVMIEFEICTAPLPFASLIKVDNGDEEGDEDEGLFEVSFGSGAFDCEPVTCTAELVCEGGGSVAVENGQLVEIEMEDDECEIEYEDGRLEIEGRIRLEVTCTNEAGTSVATAEPEGLAADDDDEDEEDEDED